MARTGLAGLVFDDQRLAERAFGGRKLSNFASQLLDQLGLKLAVAGGAR